MREKGRVHGGNEVGLEGEGEGEGEEGEVDEPLVRLKKGLMDYDSM